MNGEREIQNNNPNITQHFLYSYSNAYNLGPSEALKYLFNNDLIFDRSRKSIFTQDQEFGYVSNTLTSLEFRNADNTQNTYLTLRSYEGNIDILQYQPLKIKDVKLLNNATGEINYETTIELGGKLGLDDVSIEYTTHSTVVYSYISCNGNSESTNGLITRTQTRKLSENAISTPGIYDIEIFAYANDNTYLNLNPNKSHDSKDKHQIKTQVSYDLWTTYVECANHVHILKIPGSYWTIKNRIATWQFTDSTIVYDTLSNNWNGDTDEQHILCDNGHEESLALFTPARLQNNETIYGFVGGSSHEFMKLKTYSYTNGVSYTEDYNLYVGVGNNWQGQELWFNNIEKKTLVK